MTRLIQAIETEYPRGAGIESDPCRTVTQYFATDGMLLAERDSWTPPEKPDLTKRLHVAESNEKYWEDCFMCEAKDHKETTDKLAAATIELQKMAKLNIDLQTAASKPAPTPKQVKAKGTKGKGK